MDHVPGSESASAPAWHAMPCPQVIDRLQSDGVRGLGQVAAAARLAAGGRNRLPAPQPDAPVVVLLRQLRSPLVYVLLLAAGLSLLLGHVTDAGFIGVVLLVNSLLGAWQELQAERQSANLQGLLRVRATVQRDGSARQVDAEELVARRRRAARERRSRAGRPAVARGARPRGRCLVAHGRVAAGAVRCRALCVAAVAAPRPDQLRARRDTGGPRPGPRRRRRHRPADRGRSPRAGHGRRPSPASRRSRPAWSASAGSIAWSCWSLPC